MFRIDRTLVNLAGSQAANTNGSAAGEDGLLTGPDAPVSSAVMEREQEILENAENEAAEIIDNAKNEAASLIHNAREDAKEERMRAQQEGYAEGAREAMLELQEKLAKDDALLKNVLREIQNERTQLLGDVEDELAMLSLDIAGKIIRLAAEEDDSIFISLISTALSQMEIEGKIIIRVGAAEFSRFFKSGSAVFDLGDGMTVTASVIKDASLGDMDCIIDAENETINAGLDTQLRAIKLAFEKADGS